MACHLHDVHDLLCSRHQSVLAGFLRLGRELVYVRLFARRVVQADNSGVQVEVGVDRNRVTNIPRQTEPVRQEHERARQRRVDLAVFGPEPAVLHVFRPVWFSAVDVFQYLVKEVADHDRPGERGVDGTAEHLGERA